MCDVVITLVREAYMTLRNAMMAFAASAFIPVPFAFAGVSSPLIMWSDRSSIFGEDSRTILSKLDSRARVTNWLGAQLVDSVPLIVVFSFSSGGSPRTGFNGNSELRQHIESAKATAVIPAVELDPAFWDFANGKRFTASSIDAALTLLSSSAEELSSGRCSVMTVELDSASELEKSLDSLRIQANQVADNNVVFAVAMEPRAQSSPEYFKIMTSQRRLQEANPSRPKAFVRMTPDLFSGILTGILLLFITLIGLNCLGNIQTPSQFTDKPPPSTKEF